MVNGDDPDVGSDDPTDIFSVAVRIEDVLTALEANLRSDSQTVLRVTPPFSGRMRARLHRATDDEETPNGEASTADSSPVHVPPERLVDDAPPYPEPDDTEDELRAAGEYTVEAHRERHIAAVEEWRTEVRASMVEAVELDTPAGPHRVSVARLG